MPLHRFPVLSPFSIGILPNIHTDVMCVSMAEYVSDDALPHSEWENLALHLKARMRQLVHSEVKVCSYFQVIQERAIKF